MLSSAFARATIPAVKLGDSIRFYSDVLGLKRLDGSPQHAIFQAGKGSEILIYERGRTRAEHTAITFDVDDLDGLLRALREKGVQPEQYDMDEIKTNEKGVADMGGFRMAWIKDPAGNILGLTGK